METIEIKPELIMYKASTLPVLSFQPHEIGTFIFNLNFSFEVFIHVLMLLVLTEVAWKSLLRKLVVHDPFEAIGKNMLQA